MQISEEEAQSIAHAMNLAYGAVRYGNPQLALRLLQAYPELDIPPWMLPEGPIADRAVEDNARLARELPALRTRIKEFLEGPNHVLDRIIRSVRLQGGVITLKLQDEYPLLKRPEIARQLVDAIYRRVD